jgi:hypothetical protein
VAAAAAAAAEVATAPFFFPFHSLSFSSIHFHSLSFTGEPTLMRCKVHVLHTPELQLRNTMMLGEFPSIMSCKQTFMIFSLSFMCEPGLHF